MTTFRILPPPLTDFALVPLWGSTTHRVVPMESEINLFVKQINEYGNIQISVAIAAEFVYQ
jgi:hypothetical protein